MIDALRFIKIVGQEMSSRDGDASRRQSRFLASRSHVVLPPTLPLILFHPTSPRLPDEMCCTDMQSCIPHRRPSLGTA